MTALAGIAAAVAAEPLAALSGKVALVATEPLAALASARTEVAGYLSTVIYVYTLLIVFYIVVQLLFAFGVRIPYSRTSDAVLSFLRDVCEPYLRLFRRLIPQIGAFDFSPIVAIVVLSLVNAVVVERLIHG